ncbi:unnamed protein product [Hermetia illucens]|uniref:Potassium channel domain-containing protein n=2 Tax=Hermetia illucens TaxID=343691 RepID=A0A7R8UTD5_HERIL|nr:unnamed protein product [Hermetia illucens]
MGKVITIFYAILGIPLMLLCLSNIGDVMASSFRFLYWRVCCYVCTRETKRSRRMRQNRMSMRQPTRTRSQPPPNMRRSMRISQRSADSGFITRSEYEQNLVHSFSDPQLRYTGPRHSDRQRNHRPRDDFQYDTYNERSRDRRDRDRRSPFPRTSSKYHDYDDIYNERDDRYNERHDRRRNHYDDLDFRRNCNRNPEDDWDDRDRGRNRDRNRDRDPGRYRNQYERRASDYGRSLDPYYDPDESPRNSRRVDRTQRFSNRERNRERLRDRHTIERERNLNRPHRLDPLVDFDGPPSPRRSQSVRSIHASPSNRDLNHEYAKTLPSGGRSRGNGNPSPKSRARSVDPRAMRRSIEPDEYGIVENRYAMMTDNGNLGNHHGRRAPKYTRSYSVPRHQSNYNDRDQLGHLDIPETPLAGRRRSIDREFNDDLDDDYRMLGGRGSGGDGLYSQGMQQPRRGKQVLPPSPRILSPMGFAVHRQAKYTKSGPEDDFDIYLDEEWDSFTDLTPRNRPVPIWLCVFLVVGYIIAGAFLFSEWEHWSFLDSAYFCFITLTTIGFGDFVPAQGVKENSEVSIALCSLYLLFGISLLAMSFNLVQEEVIANVKSVARRLGILKEPEVEE